MDSKTKPPRPLFVSYWVRRAGKKKASDALDPILPRQEVGAPRYYKQLREEGRDPIWADRTEAALQAILDKLPALRGGDHRVRVKCAVSLCEISATTAPGVPQPQIDAFLNDLQARDYSTSVEKLGLKDARTMFIGARDNSRSVYIAYYSRTAG